MIKKTAGYIATVVVVASALFFANCGSREEALMEIDFSSASGWQYLLSADIYGAAATLSDLDSTGKFTGSLRVFLHGLPGADVPGGARFGLRDVTFNAPFFPAEEREDIRGRLEKLEVTISESGITLSDTIGIPGVMTGGWDILRCITRVMPVMPNVKMRVGDTWDRTQSFPFEIDGGAADGLLYQLFTLDSVYNRGEEPIAAFSWIFSYSVSTQGESRAGGGRRKILDGNGHGTAELDLNRKALVKSNAIFEVTHSHKGDMELNEIVHFQMVE